MIDEKKIPEVELDLDDVKEQEIQIKEESKTDKKPPSLNVGEVDLGYTTHSKEDKKEKESGCQNAKTKKCKIK
jgi:hypothetical protein